MATLVLGAAGSALGGPIAAAAGSFLGRQIDRSFGRGPGARLTDLKLPTAQYGDPIPQVLRRMRVAGVVLWSAQPVATATVSKSGTGQGSSVSFAFAVSTGQIEEVSRVWADGRLIRDAKGKQAVSFMMLLHKGDEDQSSDPLIASILGQARTPAFRGLAYLVFENFDLTSFGNRLPVITVELASGSEALSVEAVIKDRLCLTGRTGPRRHAAEGLALSGDDRSSALAPLIEAFSTDFSYGGRGWSLEPSLVHHRIADDLWNLEKADHSSAQLQGAADVPTRVSVRYFDPDIDFAASEKSARLPGAERMRRLELSAALHGAVAKSVAFDQLARSVTNSVRWWLNLPLSFIEINIGDEISAEQTSYNRYLICEKMLSGSQLRFGLKKQSMSNDAVAAADSGGVVGRQTLTRQPLSVSLIELPGEVFDSRPKVGVLISGGSAPFEALPVTVEYGGSSEEHNSASIPSPAGELLAPLLSAPSELLDLRNSVEVLFRTDPLLTSCDQKALLAGENSIYINGEFLQFATARPLAAGRYRLSGLIRGRFDSHIPSEHPSGSQVIILKSGAITTLTLRRESVGGAITARVHGPDGLTAETSLTIAGLSAQPWAPAHLIAQSVNNNLHLSWSRRCKEGEPWLDGVDAPVGSNQERYSVRLNDQQGGALEIIATSQATIINAASLSQLRSRPWTIEVRQLGDFAAGNPATLSLA